MLPAWYCAEQLPGPLNTHEGFFKGATLIINLATMQPCILSSDTDKQRLIDMAEPVSRPVGTAFEQAIALLDQRSLLPTCVVFALDHVLWPFTCGSTVEIPDDVALYPHASTVLAALKARGVRACACAVTAKPSAVQSLLQQLNIADYLSPKASASCQLPLIL